MTVIDLGITRKLLDAMLEYLLQLGSMGLQRNSQRQQFMDTPISIPNHFLDVSIVSDTCCSIVTLIDAVDDGLILVKELEVE